MVCCKKGNGVCVCAQEATCSCGARPAQECNCSKASSENAPINGAACSCGKRQAHACTCSRSTEENGLREGEVDFTNMK
uniref:ARAD1B14476p n=1 Tax=Blastobotrys adeninivorans TaxID=409370 RepID=A0A060T6S5_BLAAD